MPRLKTTPWDVVEHLKLREGREVRSPAEFVAFYRGECGRPRPSNRPVSSAHP